MKANYYSPKTSPRTSPRTLAAELLFWLHLPIVLALFGFFFIPPSLWPGRITFHFWYFAGVTVVQLLWGIILFPYTKRVTLICPLTTALQSQRGFPLGDPRNYNHSFIAELVARLHLKVSFQAVNVLLLILLVIVTIQYIVQIVG